MNKLIRVKYWTYADDAHLRDLKECEFDEFHEDALIKELVSNKYIICGDTHQSSEHPCIPVFNDGYLLVSMRRWGEIMDDAYMYMDPIHHREHWFYMTSVCSIKEKLPIAGGDM